MGITKEEVLERNKLIIDLIKNKKYSAIDVARKLGLSRQRIGQILHKLNLTTKRMRLVKFGNAHLKTCPLCGGAKSELAYVCRKCYSQKLLALPKKQYLCPKCGKPKGSKTAKLCRNCHITSKPKVEITCKNCGKQFPVLKSIVKIRKRLKRPISFCSRACFLEWWRSPEKRKESTPAPAKSHKAR
ncbi:MAG: hypothetical protein N2748_03510 [candidate division WOR-3 bacterium]|nr:hypothetical protein [candidate division WOR-3 bacterium]